MISLLDVDQFIKSNKLKGPVTSPQIFSGNSYSFHNLGLLSEDIFGMEGTPDRTKSYSWINLNCTVIHPALYEILLKRIERTLPRLLSGESSFDIGEDGTLVELPEGEIGELNGMADFINNIHRIKFRNAEEGDRGKIIDMLYKNVKENLFFIDKLIIMSPVYRNVEMMEDPISGKMKIEINDLTKYYKRALELSLQVKSVSGTIKDVLSYKLQELVYEIYQYIKTKISKKHGMIRRMILGKRVDYSARAVIAPDPTLNIGEVGIPLRICVSLFEPFMIYGIMNSPYSRGIPEEFFTEVKKYLGKENLIDDGELFDDNDIKLDKDLYNVVKENEQILDENYFINSILNTFLITKNSLKKIFELYKNIKTDTTRYKEIYQLKNQYKQLVNNYNIHKNKGTLNNEYANFIKNLDSIQTKLNNIENKIKETGSDDVNIGKEFYSDKPDSNSLIPNEISNQSTQQDKNINLTQYNKYLDKKSRKAWNDYWKKNCIGNQKLNSINSCKANGVNLAIQFLLSEKVKCNNFSNSEECKKTVDKLIEYWKQRKNSYFRK